MDQKPTISLAIRRYVEEGKNEEIRAIADFT
jgi:hypothetical protein